MNVLVLGSINLSKVNEVFKRKKIKNINLSTATDVDGVLNDFEERGFIFDKMLVLGSVLSSYDTVQATVIMDRLSALCKSLEKDQEVIFIDGKQKWYPYYANNLAAVTSFRYTQQRVTLDAIPDIILGRTEEAKEESLDVSKDKSKMKKVKTQEVNKAKTTPFGFFGRKKKQKPEPEHEQEQEDQEPQNISDEDEEPLFGDFHDEPEMTDMPDTLDIPDIPDDKDNLPEVLVKTSERTLRFEEEDDETPLWEDHKSEPEPKPIKPTKQSKHAKKESGGLFSKKSSFASVLQRRSRIITVTGDRRSGVSSVASNCALVAAKEGLLTLVIDMDIMRRGQAVNFPIICEPDDARYLATLINAIKSPISIEKIAIPVTDTLSYVGISLGADQIRAYKDALDSDRLMKLLTNALSKYDLIIVDCPFEDINKYECLITVSSNILHVSNNDMHAVLNTAMLLNPESFEDIGDYQLYISKATLVLNNLIKSTIDGHQIDERSINYVLESLTGEDYFRDIDVAPSIARIEDYQEIVAKDMQPAVAGHAEKYRAILNHVCEG